ncbi:tigger transposable element-derived protein 6-like [Octopus sinensis]|uniref:Tigger transposable element-derived protein 6-like n=1 Tax=Octopus sinensis TaxID=2607531 RepID=A0A6P7TYQ9_9MOLL|nr:tigger transposable element-derived protein 6-like [Octopus sinensis]
MLKLHGEMRTDKVVDINSFREEFKEISKSYKPDLIYNLDETALYYKLIPSKSVCRNRFQGYKNFKDRVSIMLCSNMTGSHKLKPVMIGKPKMPRCFKNFDYGCLVSYYSSQKAWMTGSIFIDWIISFDLQLKIKKKKILLLIDHCPAHSIPQNLDCIKILFFPKNSTGLLQPMDIGIIKTFKTHFMRRKLQYLTDLLETENISILNESNHENTLIQHYETEIERTDIFDPLMSEDFLNIENTEDQDINENCLQEDQESEISDEETKIIYPLDRKDIAKTLTKIERQLYCNAENENDVSLITAIRKYKENDSLYYIGLIDIDPTEFEVIDKKIRGILIQNKIHLKPANKERLYLPRIVLKEDSYL